MTDKPEVRAREEIWKLIPGSEFYEVSTFGRVRSLPHNNTKGKILKPGHNPKGYPNVCVNLKGIRKTKTVHRLMAMAFLELKPGLQVNHKDGNKNNNLLTNLEVCTQKYNQLHRVYKLKKQNPGANTHRHQEIIDLFNGGMRMFEIIKKLGLTKSAVRYAIRRSIRSGNCNPATGSAKEKHDRLGLNNPTLTTGKEKLKTLGVEV